MTKFGFPYTTAPLYGRRGGGELLVLIVMVIFKNWNELCIGQLILSFGAGVKRAAL